MPTTDLNGLPPAPPEELIPENDPGAEVNTEEHDDTDKNATNEPQTVED
jgi:hypothetical protein